MTTLNRLIKKEIKRKFNETNNLKNTSNPSNPNLHNRYNAKVHDHPRYGHQ